MTTTALVDTEDVRAGVDALLDAHLSASREALDVAFGADALPLVDATEVLLRGGKRLRAAFAYWSWRAHGGDPSRSEPALHVGAALELFQAAALFHDDVMDNSDTRRGAPTAHVTFTARHRANAWAGDAAQFGMSAAILLGDLALVASEDLLHRGLAALDDADAAARERTRAIFSAMRTEVTIGQYLDMLSQTVPWHDDHAAAERRARHVIRAKSARYSVEHPMTMGAALAGATSEQVAAIARVGLPLGEAFQLRDDVLGVFGDPAATGKPAGDDLREGKRTVLVVRAVASASPAEREVLLRDVGRPDLEAADIERLREIIVGTGALASVDALVDELATSALEALEGLALAAGPRDMLGRLGRAAVARQA